MLHPHRIWDSLEALVLIGKFFCPSFIFFGDGTGDDALSDVVLGRFGYHYPVESGRWFAFPPFWCFASPFRCSSYRRVETDDVWRQTPTSPAKRWQSAIFLDLYIQRLIGMLVSPACFSWGQFKLCCCFVGWWSAAGCLLRPSASRTTGIFLQGCVWFFFFHQRVSL